jgi:hypothetical protein
VSSIRGDKAWVLVSFIIWNGNQRIRMRLYPGIRDTRKGRRSPVIKEIRALIEARRWDELARCYPCMALGPFRARDSGARRDYVPASLGTVSRVSEEYERQGYRALL